VSVTGELISQEGRVGKALPHVSHSHRYSFSSNSSQAPNCHARREVEMVQHASTFMKPQRAVDTDNDCSLLTISARSLALSIEPIVILLASGLRPESLPYSFSRCLPSIFYNLRRRGVLHRDATHW
jgi:hypothetical protein